MQKNTQNPLKINIIGQGLAGSILAYTLKKMHNCQVQVFNNEALSTSSEVAAGIYNPITGKRMTKTWLADTIFPFMFDFYSAIETKFDINILYNTPVFKAFADMHEQNFWMGKTADDAYKNNLEIVQNIEKLATAIPHDFGGMCIKNSGRLDINLFLSTLRQYFIYEKCYTNCQSLPNFESHETVIFCEGAYSAQNPLWDWLPWQCNKGEILDVAIASLSDDYIVNSSLFVMPISQSHFRVGATYHHHDYSNIPTQKGVEELKHKLESFLKFPYQIEAIKCGIRPAVQGRRPFLGQHPTYKNYYIFNGFGSKAVSMAPFFAQHFANYLLHHQPLMADVQLDRVVQW